MKVLHRGLRLVALGVGLLGVAGCEDSGAERAGGPGTVPADYPKSSEEARNAMLKSAPQPGKQTAQPKPAPAPALSK